MAYIYLPDTSMGGSTRFNREFYAQVGKEGAIIDERFNGGGSLADQVIDALARTPRNYASTREGAGSNSPQPGKRTMLCKNRREPATERY